MAVLVAVVVVVVVVEKTSMYYFYRNEKIYITEKKKCRKRNIIMIFKEKSITFFSFHLCLSHFFSFSLFTLFFCFHLI